MFKHNISDSKHGHSLSKTQVNGPKKREQQYIVWFCHIRAFPQRTFWQITVIKINKTPQKLSCLIYLTTIHLNDWLKKVEWIVPNAYHNENSKQQSKKIK